MHTERHINVYTSYIWEIEEIKVWKWEEKDGRRERNRRET